MSTPPRPQAPGPGHQWPPPSPLPVWGPPAHAYPPALNGFALASLLVGLLCFPPLGIVFGVVALVQIARKRERGRVLAVVGLVVSLVMTVVAAVGIDAYGRTFLDRMGPSRTYEEAEGEPAVMEELRAGECFNVPGGDLLDEDPLAHRIGCGQVHDAEVTSTTLLDIASFPGTQELQQTVTDMCWKAQDAYAMDTWALPAYAEMFYFAPSHESWRAGDRRLICVIGTAEQEHRGSLREDEGMLTPEQVTLLRSLNTADQALGRGPDAEVADALPRYRTWAREVEEALGAEVRMLKDVTRRPGTGPAAAAQLGEIEAARGAWQKASGASRPADFQAAWDQALAAVSVDTEKALRGAYGLSTVVPEWLEDYPGDAGEDAGGAPSAESV
ncbi:MULTISPECIES: DUF4190 domain-containing protein [unclassified Streptomyces]|uniref:DUF4190 domain-containing protein n=1 Tax=unclassified Streptomyces TaxID=2593676 RepID=UPI0029B5EB26|nr:DUF4190 domain-containing protein [Streptomyces sp. DK15]MDX2389809.1 DUF4190 domain-containing protein [Streptomyces sp. DK15]